MNKTGLNNNLMKAIIFKFNKIDNRELSLHNQLLWKKITTNIKATLLLITLITKITKPLNFHVLLNQMAITVQHYILNKVMAK